ncbi:MAG: amidophosphoribosyltransferase [Alphaproteobacteria bacterium]|nr:amidophosphoribosyltransferase [Alphaproteobacteria bacterium]
MCGIVGLFAKKPALEKKLGGLLTQMLVAMSDRGPDSAGFAVYRSGVKRARGRKRQLKFTLHHPDLDYDWGAVKRAAAKRFKTPATLDRRSNHAVLALTADAADVAAWITAAHPELRLMGWGEHIEVFKDVGSPASVAERFGLARLDATHALGHTRMATESAVTTEHSHPFSVGAELCLVHNGSLSNHNRLRGQLRRQGITFRTDNDSEVAAGYFAWRLGQGASLKEALEAGLKDLDGFFTFAVGTPDGFAVVRDAIACKPAMLAETADWVGMASEYRAFAGLPGIADARIWEPAPSTVYSWSRH